MLGRRFIIYILLFASIVAAKAQDSTPVVRVWDKNSHQQANQIWSVTCDDDGRAYFGNANGLLSFDSDSWTLTPIRDGKIVRSTYYDDGRIYVGSFEEFGYFTRQDDGTMLYTSLSARLENYTMNNNEIWNIFRYEEYIIFHSFVTLFFYNTQNDKVSFIDAGGFNESIGIDSESRLLSSNYGFSVLDPELEQVVPIPHTWKDRMVAVLTRGKGRDLIVTKGSGIYLWNHGELSKWKTDCEDKLINGEINKAFLSSGGDIILGSSLYGCTAIDSTGKRLWSINASNVLNGNTILNIAENLEGDIFLAMDSGIALVDRNSGIRHINRLGANVGAVYCVHYQTPYIHIGTNQGLYTGILDEADLSVSQIQQNKEIKGPVLYLEQIDNQLFCGTNADTYTLNGRLCKKLSVDNAGGACIAKGIINGSEVLVEGTYTKLCLYTRKDGRWVYSHRIDDFIEPISTIDIDFTGNIWASHNNRGLYRLRLSSDLKRVSRADYFPNLYGDGVKIRIKKINGRTIFYDNTSFCTYDDNIDSIVVYKPLDSKLSEIDNIMAINEYDSNSYWFVNQDNAYLIDSDFNILDKVSYSIFNSNSVDMLKQISPGPDNTAIMTLNNSLAFIPVHTVRESPKWEPDLKLERINVSCSDGSRPENISLNDKLTWDYDKRLVKFYYSYPHFTEIGNKHLEYKVSGRDEVWRRSDGQNIDLSHLKEGHYNISVRMVNNAGETLDTLDTSFYIKPPFWRTSWAYIIYTLWALATVAFIIISIRRRITAKKNELEKKRLESELDAKSREIASTTMSLLNKNKILLDLKEELSVQKNAIGSGYPDEYYRKMVSTIDSHISSEKDWELFQKNFDMVHGDFFKILKSRYPALTDSDLRFCSYLCMNMSSKEIASMMNISLKGVEAARYRIRKKIGLPSNISLSSFLMDLK